MASLLCPAALSLLGVAAVLAGATQPALALSPGVAVAVAQNGWCQPTQPCWPSVAEVVALQLECDGKVITQGSALFDDAIHVKNLRFNTTRPGIVLEA